MRPRSISGEPVRATVRVRATVLVLVGLLLVLPPVPPGLAPNAKESPTPSDRDEDLTVPRPYEPDEFPRWSRDLRRFEIVAFGAFPLAIILSGIGYQLSRFTINSVEKGDISQEHLPFFLSPEPGPRYDEDERRGLLLSAAVISLGVAVADFLLGRWEERERR